MLHGCHNRQPFKEELKVQSGWTEDGRRVMVTIPFRMSHDCEYDLKKTDVGCNGCRWADKESKDV